MVRYSKRRKLEAYQVVLIRQLRREGFRRYFIGKILGVSRNVVQLVLSGSTYKDVR